MCSDVDPKATEDCKICEEAVNKFGHEADFQSVDTAIALRGFSTTTAAHALRFYTEARFILNIIMPCTSLHLRIH